MPTYNCIYRTCASTLGYELLNILRILLICGTACLMMHATVGRIRFTPFD